MRRRAALALVDAFRNEKDGEEDEREGDAAHGRYLFGNQIDSGDREEQRGDDAESERKLVAAETDIEWHFPFARAAIFEAQHEHRQSFESERPDDAEGVSLAEHIDVAA